MKFYHKEHCPICTGAEFVLKKLDVEYEDIMIDDSNLNLIDEFIEKGFQQMPILVIDTGEVYAGAAVRKYLMGDFNKK